MQIKNILLKKKLSLGRILKALVLVASLYYIGFKFSTDKVTLDSFDIPEHLWFVVFICLFLMVINWTLEAYRWKVSVSPFQEVSFSHSINVILAGLSMNFLIPFTAGDALARILPYSDKLRATAAMVLNRGIMFSMTVLFGMLAVGSYFEVASILPLLLAGFIIGVLIFLFFRRKLLKMLSYFNSLSVGDVFSLVGLSVLRYLIFILQFYLLLKVFLPELSNQAILAGIGWIFLAKSAFPSFFGGIGVREAFGVLYFSGQIPDSAMVVVPIFMLWVINTMIPSVVGLLSVWNLKFDRSGWSFSR